jgi:hypothetical protein
MFSYSFGGFNLFRDAGRFISNVAKTAGRDIDKASKIVQDTVGSVTDEIGKIPIIGAPIHSIFDAGWHLVSAPVVAVVDIAKGERIDRVGMDFINTEVKDVKNNAQYVKMAVSVIPGIGTCVASTLGVGLALANGQPIDKALIAGAVSAIPGGPIAQAAANMTMSTIDTVARGEKVTVDTLANGAAGIAADALGLADSAKKALLAGTAMMGQLASGKPIDPSLALAAINSVPLPDSVKNGLDQLSQMATKIGQGTNVSPEMLEQIQQIEPMIPIDNGLKGLVGNAVESNKIPSSNALSGALNSSVIDNVMAPVNKSLPKEQQDAQRIGAALQTAMIQQANRAAQLASTAVLNKLMQSGIQISKTVPTVAEARKLVKTGVRGFDIAIGLLNQKSEVFDIATVRSQLNADEQKAYDAACALKVGLTTNPPKSMTAAARAGHAMTMGMQGAHPDVKAGMMASIVKNPSATVGAKVAVDEIATRRSSWIDRILDWLGLL